MEKGGMDMVIIIKMESLNLKLKREMDIIKSMMIMIN